MLSPNNFTVYSFFLLFIYLFQIHVVQYICNTSNTKHVIQCTKNITENWIHIQHSNNTFGDIS